MDPRAVFLSKHFRLSDFLGSHSAYALGYANDAFNMRFYPFEQSMHFGNGEALCRNVLEPILERFGPISISYGIISPEFSRKTVAYQDPDKPSHHLWNLGAAADFVVHKWVQGLPNEPAMRQLFENENTATSPASLAHEVDDMGIPYSRMITYSESPYICLAVSAIEVVRNEPRKAFYENRYEGVKGRKPKYISQSNPTARRRVSEYLQGTGLPVPWQGHGYPTSHGGGRIQYQHNRVSKYTMVSDWLFDLKSISEGHRNQPDMTNERVMDSFAAAGIVYDRIVEETGIPRFSILRGYISPSNPSFNSDNDWRSNDITFVLGLPNSSPEKLDQQLLPWICELYKQTGVYYTKPTFLGGKVLKIHVNVDQVLNDAA